MLIFQEDVFVESFRRAHPFWNNPFETRPPTKVVEYFDLCIQTNEIVGVTFTKVEGVGYLGIPDFMDGFAAGDKIKNQLLSPHTVPEKIPDSEDITVKLMMRAHWFKKDIDRLYALTECDDPHYIMREALVVAHDVLERSPSSLGVVCGPISSGPLSVKENLKRFSRAVFKLGQEIPMFNQLPFEPVFHRVHGLIDGDRDLCVDGNSSKFFIDNFYAELFRLPEITWFPHFLYGYKKSTGAMLEHAIFEERHVSINYLPVGFTKRLF